jgi:hypothetical protein
MEAIACLDEQPEVPVLLLFGDEPLSGEFVTFGADDVDLPLVVALALRIPRAADDEIFFNAESRKSHAPPSTAVALDFLRFLLSGEQVAVSEGIRMTWMWRRAG